MRPMKSLVSDSLLVCIQEDQEEEKTKQKSQNNFSKGVREQMNNFERQFTDPYEANDNEPDTLKINILEEALTIERKKSCQNEQEVFGLIEKIDVLEHEY